MIIEVKISTMESESIEIEQQLKIWKELAVSKQMLIGTLAKSLGLKEDCDSSHLQEKLNELIQRLAKSDTKAQHLKEETQALLAIEKTRLADSQVQLKAAQAGQKKADDEIEKMQTAIATAKADHAQNIQKIKAKIAKKEQELAAINKALNDKPENVLKKLTALKKQKLDMAKMQKQTDSALRDIRKQKQRLQQRQHRVEESAKKLVEQYRTLHRLAGDLYDQCHGCVDDPTTLPLIPDMDEDLLKTLDQSSE